MRPTSKKNVKYQIELHEVSISIDNSSPISPCKQSEQAFVMRDDRWFAFGGVVQKILTANK